MGRTKGKHGPLVFLLGIVLIGCLIQAAGWMKGDRLVFPGVLEILKAFFRLLGERQTYARIWVTLRHLILAVAVSSAIGIPLGLAEGSNAFLRNLLKPLMILLRSIPMIVMVVVVMVLSRYENVPLIATSMLLVPLISEATCQGFLELDRDLLDVYRLEGKLSFRIVRMVHLPLMAGYVRQAYISAVGIGMKLVVSTEYLVQTRNSLGKAIHSSGYFNEYQDIYAYALIMVLLVLLVSELPLHILRKLGSDRT